MTQLIPKSVSAQGACSRLDPQPKLSPATMILACRYGPWLSTKSGFSEPSARKRTSSNRCFDNPVRLIVRRWIAGKILSVSILIIGIGAATPVSVVNFSMKGPLGYAAGSLGNYNIPRAEAGSGRRRERMPHPFVQTIDERAFDNGAE